MNNPSIDLLDVALMAFTAGWLVCSGVVIYWVLMKRERDDEKERRKR